jgi:hypothetical protein
MTLAINCTCGAHLELDDRFAGQTIHCPDCGKGLLAPAVTTGKQQQTSALALASLILALVGGFTIVGTIVAVVLGVLALRQISRQRAQLTGRRIALAGIGAGALLTALSLLLYLKGNFLGLDRFLRASLWAGKLDYSESLEVASGGIVIKRPTKDWGHYHPRETQDNVDQPSKPGFVILVNLREDAHAIGFSFPKGQLAEEDYTAAAIKKFLQSELVRLLSRKRSGDSLADYAERERKEIPVDADRKGEELYLDVCLGKHERTFLLRRFEKDGDLWVVAAGARKTHFRALEDQQFRQIVDSFKLDR